MVTCNQWQSQRRGEGGHLSPLTPPKIFYSNLKELRNWHRKKKGKKWLPETFFFWEWTPWHLKVTLTQGKESKKKKVISNIKSYSLFTYFTVLVIFSLVPRLTSISQFHNFFYFFISIILFTVYNTFYSILLLNDVRDITNFTIYILKISMSPITKINHKHLFIILFK